jgi:hypothetical protein
MLSYMPVVDMDGVVISLWHLWTIIGSAELPWHPGSRVQTQFTHTSLRTI